MKVIKDPLYGYIEIEDEFVDIINSASFQRLRYIIQTSYSSIFPSSIHNRFCHSLGVYHLGKRSFDSLLNHLEKRDKELLSPFRRPFLFACLCHDIGHTPFSHTGEDFFDSQELTHQLQDIVANSEYNQDLNGEAVGKNHEIMSALLSLKKFPDSIEKENYDFVARCIIGLKYTDTSKKINCLKNSCVELLNSQIIDVDKLDYLIRDSYMSGFSSSSVDYVRLIDGIRYSDNKDISIRFSKHSLNVLENVLSAHDLEVRWLQSHPSNCYEAYLLKSIICLISNDFKGLGLFSINSLLEEGVKKGNLAVRLLSDSDIIYLAKQYYDSSQIVKEYFNRSIRKKPLWKTEAEFNALFAEFDFENTEFFAVLDSIDQDMSNGECCAFSIDDKYIDYLESQKQLLLDEKEDKKSCESAIETIDKKINFVNGIKTYLEKNNLEFDFLFLYRDQFVRNIIKPKFKQLEIVFENMSLTQKMCDISSVSQSKNNKNKRYFYFFYKKTNGNSLDVRSFSEKLKELINDDFRISTINNKNMINSENSSH